MSNTISFKFASSEISESIQSVSNIAGQIDVALNSINLRGLTTDSALVDTSSIKSDQDAVKTPVGGIGATRYIINDSTDNLFTSKFLTDERGYIDIDLTSMLSNSRLLKFYAKYSDTVVLSVTITTPKTSIYSSLTANFKISEEWKQSNEKGI